MQQERLSNSPQKGDEVHPTSGNKVFARRNNSANSLI